MSILLNGGENVEKFSKGDILFKEGALPEHFYLILSGNVTCFKKHNDRLVPVFTAGEKEIVGEDCVLADSNKYFYSAVVMEDSQLVKIEKSEVYEFLNLQKDWIKNILKNISDKINHTTEIIAEHRILDNRLVGEIEFSDDQEAKLKKDLKITKSKKPKD